MVIQGLSSHILSHHVEVLRICLRPEPVKPVENPILDKAQCNSFWRTYCWTSRNLTDSVWSRGWTRSQSCQRWILPNSSRSTALKSFATTVHPLNDPRSEGKFMIIYLYIYIYNIMYVYVSLLEVGFAFHVLRFLVFAMVASSSSSLLLR